MSQLDRLEKQYQAELLNCAEQLRNSEKYLLHLEGQLRILEAENDFLCQENAEYERKLSLVTSNPFSKVGLKLYHIYHRMKQKV